MKATHKMYSNGVVRDTDGQLVAFYDAQRGVVGMADGREFQASDAEHAMDLVAEHA